MPRRNCAAGTAGRPSRLKTRRAFFSAPQQGVFAPLGKRGRTVAPHNGAGFFLLLEEGERLRPTFLFLLREKKKRADLRAKCLASLGCAPKRACGRRPGTKKKSAGSGFRDESCSFFLCVYVLIVGSLVLCGLVSSLAPLPLTGARKVRFLLFGIESIFF